MKSKIDQRPTRPSRTLLLNIWKHICPHRRVEIGLTLLVMLASAGAEMLSLGALLPFLAVLSEPERLWRQPLVQYLASIFSLTGANQLLIPVTVSFILAALFAALIRLWNLWLNCRLAAAIGSDLSCEAYKRTIYQPYSVHLKQNSSTVISGITTFTMRTVLALIALLQMMTSAMVATGLLVAMLLINWTVALGTYILFGLIYFTISLIARRELTANSRRIAERSVQQVKALQEGLGAIRDVLLNGNQDKYLEIYRLVDWPQRQLLARNNFLGAFPRFLVEALGMSAIAVLGALMVSQGSGTAVIPLLGVLALGTQRLLPCLQQIYASLTALRACNADMDGIVAMLDQPICLPANVSAPLPFQDKICFQDVHFKYDSDQPEVLNGLNFEICRGERIGLIGTTGSGKSTTVDLLMGLLKPTSGKVMVDGQDLHHPETSERLSSWWATIAHVPQTIYLADSSIAENIAFGVPLEDIDLIRVKQAAEQAQIASFIESGPNGYWNIVGERGIRLSGGQRQRIGIARALYKQARFLVFDEATSALDTSTEEAVISAVESLSKDLTIVMIAHRLSTVQRCDRVLKLDHGNVVSDAPPHLTFAK
jgi:ABC-type multidrug transport system fused ATPase/permease subunit